MTLRKSGSQVRIWRNCFNGGKRMEKIVVLLMAFMAVTAMSAFAEVANVGMPQAIVSVGAVDVLSGVSATLQPLGTSLTIRAGTTSAMSFLVSFAEVSTLTAAKDITAVETSLCAQVKPTVGEMATNEGSECVRVAEKVFGVGDACMASFVS